MRRDCTKIAGKQPILQHLWTLRAAWRRCWRVAAWILPLGALCLLSGPAGAVSSAWQGDGESRVRLFSAPDRDGQVYLALQIQLAPGWKTYWRNAGDAGAPPQLNWQGSQNITNLSARWPAPERFRAFGYDSFGYHHQLVLPFRARIADPARPSRANLSVEYLICSKVCLPQSAKLSLDIPASDPAGTVDIRLLRRALSQVPPPNGAAPLRITDVSLGHDNDGQVLRVSVETRTIFGAPDLLVEAPTGYSFSPPMRSYSADRKHAVLAVRVRHDSGTAPSLAGRKLRLTVVDDTESVDYRLVLPPGKRTAGLD